MPTLCRCLHRFPSYLPVVSTAADVVPALVEVGEVLLDVGHGRTRALVDQFLPHGCQAVHVGLQLLQDSVHFLQLLMRVATENFPEAVFLLQPDQFIGKEKHTFFT